MRLFSEEVKTTSSNSPLNIIQVANFQEIFFGVLEIEINEKKYPVEEVAKHGGNPVVLLPIVVEGVEREYPFLLLKGKQEIFFNENNTEIPVADEEILEESVEIDNEQILVDIEKLKKDSVRKAQEELSRHLEIVKEKTKREKQKKEKALKLYLESARENLVDEFTTISQRIKKEVFDNNDEKYSEIRETIDNKIEEIRDSLDESLKKDFNKSSQLIDKSIKQLVKDLYEKNINPKVDRELHNIATEIHEKVSEIDKNLNSKLGEKADRSLLEGVSKEINTIRDANIELNNSLNKGVQKALSRVGNVDKKVIQIAEEFEQKLDEKEREVTQYFDEKLALVKEETLDITDEARKYFQNLIQESRNNLLTEIRKIKAEKPVEYILETKKSGKVVKDWDSIEKDWNTKIHDKIENVKTDLRKYVTVYASGGGTNATQYQDGGTMNGDLNVTGAYLSGGVNLLDIFSGGSGGGSGGSDVSGLSANWQNTYTTVQANSATWNGNSGDDVPVSTKVRSASAYWDSTYTTVQANSATWGTGGGGSDVSTLSSNWQDTYNQVNTLSSNWNYQGTDLKALSANWQNTYTTVQANSATWSIDNSGSDVSSLSANWENTYNQVYNLSSNWQDTYTVVQANSASWSIDNSGSDVSTLSANWENTYNQVNTLSSNWNYQGTDLKALSANWQNTYTQVYTLSSGWNNTNHNALSSLQGGVVGEYYHLTLSEQLSVTNIPTLIPNYIGGTNSLSIVAGAVAINANNGRSQKLTLTADVTSFGTPTNLADGQSMTIVGKQDGTGGRAFTLASGYIKIGGGLETDISALTANQRFLLAIVRDSSDYLVTIATE